MSVGYCKNKVVSNTLVQDNIYKLQVEFTGNVSAGQFFMLRCWGKTEAPLLSRPISVHDYQNNTLTFLYEVKGIGTEKLMALKQGDFIELTGASGNGFPLDKIKGKVAVVAGGIGVAPLLYLVKSLTDCETDLFCGFRDTSYAVEDFKPYVKTVNIATDTGNEGTKGFVTSLFDIADYDTVVTCGPEIMMNKLGQAGIAKNVTVYVSKEAKMACGVGACLGCTCKTKNGGKSICKDGPVFNALDLLQEEGV